MFASRAAHPMITLPALAGLAVLSLTPATAVAQGNGAGWEGATFYHTHAEAWSGFERGEAVADRARGGTDLRLVPAPAAVRVDPPELAVVDLEEVEIRPVLKRPELPRPPLGTLIVTIPAAPEPVHVEPPTILMPDLEEAKIAPVLQLPDSAGRTDSADRRNS